MADQPFQITAAVLDTVRDLSAEGFKAREIAPRLGISETAVYTYIKRNIEFARAVADGKKAFKDAEKVRKEKAQNEKAAAAKKAAEKAAEKAAKEKVNAQRRKKPPPQKTPRRSEKQRSRRLLCHRRTRRPLRQKLKSRKS